MCNIEESQKHAEYKNREQNDTYCIIPFIITSNTGYKSHSSGFIDRYVYTHTHTHIYIYI